MSKINFSILPRPKHVYLLITTKLWAKFLLFPTFQFVGFEEHIEKMVLQPGSSISSAIDYFIHLKVVASFLCVPLPSSSYFHVCNTKWKLEFGGQKPNPKITKF
jgi:hypothetical protein